MAKKDEIKEETRGSKDLLNSILKATKEDHYAYVESKNKVISTGSLILDGLVKVRTGSVVRLVGKGAELGKTSESFVLAANFMEAMPKSKTIYVKAESRLSEEMKIRSGIKFVTEAENWEYGTVFIYPCNTFEIVADLLESMLKQMHELGEYLCIIIDSLDGMILKNDLTTKGISGNTKVAGVPLLTKLMFRRLALPINHYDALLLITGQYSAEIKLDPYSKEPPRQAESSGGSAIGHQSDYVFSYGVRYGGDYILEKPDEKPDFQKNKTLGVYATIEIKKSSTDVTGTKVKIPIKKGRIGCAIWIEKEVVDIIVGFQLINKKGSWLSFHESIIKEAKDANVILKEQIQGINQLYDYMEENKDVFHFFLNKIKKLYE